MSRQQSIKERGTKADSRKTVIKKPFKVYQHKRRKYVRLEVNSPLKFKVFNPPDLDLNLDDKQTCIGSVMNISGGGVLMETEYKVRENDYLIMEMSLLDADTMTGIIGKVKRVDSDEKEHPLIGVEFMSPEQLQEEMPAEILDCIGEKIFSFDEQIRRMLLKYVFSRKVNNA
jgi:c-di-GMP-binding flagellar brake protein YcgR